MADDALVGVVVDAVVVAVVGVVVVDGADVLVLVVLVVDGAAAVVVDGVVVVVLVVRWGLAACTDCRAWLIVAT